MTSFKLNVQGLLSAISTSDMLARLRLILRVKIPSVVVEIPFFLSPPN